MITRAIYRAVAIPGATAPFDRASLKIYYPAQYGDTDEELDMHRFRDALSDRLGRLADWQTEIFEMRPKTSGVVRMLKAENRRGVSWPTLVSSRLSGSTRASTTSSVSFGTT